MNGDKTLNSSTASFILKSSSFNDSILTDGRDSRERLQIRGFEMHHQGQTYETFLNLNGFDNLYDTDQSVELFSNRRGVTKIKHSNLQIDKITTILYELVEAKNI